MPKTTHPSCPWHYAWVLVAAVMMTLSSCISDDDTYDECGLTLRFRYAYNVKNADAFTEEVRHVDLYVFDAEGKYVKTYSENGNPFASNYTMSLRDLPSGKYTFVALGRGDKPESSSGEFEFPQLTANKSTLQDLNMHLAAQNATSTGFASLYSGTLALNVSTSSKTETVDLMKLTNTYRVIIIPNNNRDEVTTDRFDVSITGNAPWLNPDGSRVEKEDITYLPHNAQMVSSNGEVSVSGEAIDRALVYDLCSSRLFAGDNTQRIVVTDKTTGKVLFDHSLPWLLALYGGDERLKTWDDQEYLDRQDHYVLTFYVNTSTGPSQSYAFAARLKVNNWVLNLVDLDI